MKKYFTQGLLIFFVFPPCLSKAQFVLNNNASIDSVSCSGTTTTYELTPLAFWQGGSIWYKNLYNLTQALDVKVKMFLGTKSYSTGADGICFVLQPLSTNAGAQGGGLGFQGISPSLGVEFDSYQNQWDPSFCHVAIEKNGDVDHTDGSGNQLAGPVQLSPTNAILPDGAWHDMRISWNPVTDSLKVYFDCNLRLSYQGDIVDSIFNGNPNVYWGFTASTGGAENKQEICIQYSYLNNLRDTVVCEAGDPVTLSASGGVSYAWSPAAGLSGISGPSVTATPASTTKYYVTITDVCGNTSIDSATITIQTPKASFTADPLEGVQTLSVNFKNNSTNGTSYLWLFGDSTGSILQNPPAKVYTDSGKYKVKLIVANSIGCLDSETVTILVEGLSEITIPNIFTPNGDGQNDVFSIKTKEIQSIEVKIYDRWGLQIAVISNISGSWNGKNSSGSDAPSGTYYYILQAKGFDSKSYKMKGFVELVR